MAILVELLHYVPPFVGFVVVDQVGADQAELGWELFHFPTGYTSPQEVVSPHASNILANLEQWFLYP